jgi:plastocyanin
VTTLVGLLLMVPAVVVAATRPVTIRNVAYAPQQTFAYPGDTVRWTHKDGSTPHTVTADDGSFDSSPGVSRNGFCSPLNDDCMYENGNNSTFRQEFPSLGTFGYHCKIHESMRGTVRVVPRGQPTSSASASATPSGPSPKPTKTSPSPSPTGSATGTATGTASPTGSPSATATVSPLANGEDSGSGKGRVVIAAIGVAILSGVGFLVYRRFLASP